MKIDFNHVESNKEIKWHIFLLHIFNDIRFSFKILIIILFINVIWQKIINSHFRIFIIKITFIDFLKVKQVIMKEQVIICVIICIYMKILKVPWMFKRHKCA